MTMRLMVIGVAAALLMAFAAGMEFANVQHEAAQQKLFATLHDRGCTSNATRIVTPGW